MRKVKIIRIEIWNVAAAEKLAGGAETGIGSTFMNEPQANWRFVVKFPERST
jgi:hypothetical protein